MVVLWVRKWWDLGGFGGRDWVWNALQWLHGDVVGGDVAYGVVRDDDGE